MTSFGDIQGWLHGSATAQLKALAAGSDPLKLLAAMAIAAVFGMVHALMPGHGKAVIVSYYLGRPARLFGSIGTSAFRFSRMSVPRSSWCSQASWWSAGRLGAGPGAGFRGRKRALAAYLTRAFDYAKIP